MSSIDAILGLARDADRLALGIDGAAKASVLFVAALVAVALLRRGSAALRHGVWRLAFCAVLSAPLLSAMMPQWRIPLLPSQVAVAASEAGPRVDVAQPMSERAFDDPAPATPIGQFAGADLPGASIDLQRESAARQAAGNMAVGATSGAGPAVANDAAVGWTAWWAPFVVWTWGFGLVVVLAPLFVGAIRSRRLQSKATRLADPRWIALVDEVRARLGLRRNVRLFALVGNIVPMTWGVSRPVVVLPGSCTEWSPRRRRMVLLHELAHVERLDLPFQMLAHVACAIHWFNPLAWYGLHRLRVEREQACDDCVVHTGERASDYASELISIAESHRAGRLCLAVAMARSSRLEDRLRSLFDRARSHLPASRSSSRALLAGATLLVACVAMIRPVERMVMADDSATAPNQAKQATDDGDVVTVTGVVLKPDGTPAAGATIRAAAPVPPNMRPYLGANIRSRDFDSPMLKTTVDERGEFSIDIRKNPFGDVRRLDPQWRDLWKETVIAASLEGFGPEWIEYEEIEPGKPVSLRLVEDLPIRGRVIDLQGRSVAGTTVRISGPRTSKDNDLSEWLAGVKAGGFSQTLHRTASRSVGRRLVGTPSEVKTEADGLFEIRGMGRERLVDLTFEGSNVAHRVVNVVTREMAPMERIIGLSNPTRQPVFGAAFTYTAAPSRPIIGVVVDAATGDPLPGVAVESEKLADYPFSNHRVLKTVSDRQGRFRIVGMPKGVGNRLMVVPNDDQPYFMRETDVPNPVELGPVEIRIELHPGIWITGRVTDKVTGEPVGGVQMYQFPLLSNEFARAIPEFHAVRDADGDEWRYFTKSDGTYRLVGLPGRAIVGAWSVLKTYRAGVGYREINAPKDPSGGWVLAYGANSVAVTPTWPSVMREISAPAGVKTVNVDLQLDAGASVRLRIVDEQGNPVAGAEIDGLRPVHGDRTKSDAVCTAVNFSPAETRTITVHHKERNIGRVVVIGPKEIAQGQVTVTLLPCARLRGRLLKNEEPIGGLEIFPSTLPRSDHNRSMSPVSSDAAGRFACTLLPGCDYLLYAQGAGVDALTTIVEPLSIKPGETKDLGTLTLGNDRKFIPEKKAAQR